ncbi:MAG TPA: FAD:protein FMN transferase [Phnomibacter sp.]|nr:FAD:protein FMN transferase [Phnomibacter sp.]
MIPIGIPLMRPLLFTTIMVLFFFSCGEEVQNTLHISGPAQGTTYNITYVAGAYANYRQEIDSIFSTIDGSLSTYQPGSIISRINRNEPAALDTHFIAVCHRAKEVFERTEGLFDPTVAPLVNAYGFGFKKKEEVTPHRIDSLKKIIGFRHVRIEGDKLFKDFPEVTLDFNAIAPGYTVDVLAAFLEKKGIKHYLIELGGEVRSKGKRLDGSAWTLGIEQPEEDPSEGVRLHSRIPLGDLALATSGNYKNFYLENGKKYSHIIDPVSGYPAKNSLLSATVIAPDCTTADAYATAFMIMGLQKAQQFLEAHAHLGLSVFFIYDHEGTTKTWASPDFPAPVE